MSYKHFYFYILHVFLASSAADYFFSVAAPDERPRLVPTRWHMLSSSKNPVSKTPELDSLPKNC